MTWFWNIDLIHLFGFYLALMFIFSAYRRFAQYRAIGGLVVAGPGRWPRLIDLIRQHGRVFLTWSTFLPAILTLVLTVIHLVFAQYVAPHAALTTAGLAGILWAWPLALLSGAAMLAVDVYCNLTVEEIDQHLMQKYFDEAEYWLRSWTAPVVHFFTLGQINPRQMVRVEVQKALVEASELINTSLWWVAVQTALRVAFGVTLWLAVALY